VADDEHEKIIAGGEDSQREYDSRRSEPKAAVQRQHGYRRAD